MHTPFRICAPGVGEGAVVGGAALENLGALPFVALMNPTEGPQPAGFVSNSLRAQTVGVVRTSEVV